MLNPQLHLNLEIYYPWKYHDSIFHRFWENEKQFLKFSTLYLITGSDIFEVT